MTEHTTGCEVTKYRRQLTDAITAACNPNLTPLNVLTHADGSEEEMMLAFSILRGIVTEYQEGGDQEQEVCTCEPR